MHFFLVDLRGGLRGRQGIPELHGLVGLVAFQQEANHDEDDEQYMDDAREQEQGALALPVHEDRGDERFNNVDEKMKEVMQAVDNLPLNQRELFAMANIEGMKYKEISEVLNIPVGTVKTRMHTLMKKLRAELI